MRMNTIESDFEYQAKEILLKVLKNYDIENLDDAEDFQDEIWNNKHIMLEIGKQFIENLNNYSGDDVFEEVMEGLAEEQDDDEEDFED